jgi:hypothetical protein
MQANAYFRLKQFHQCRGAADSAIDAIEKSNSPSSEFILRLRVLCANQT